MKFQNNVCVDKWLGIKWVDNAEINYYSKIWAKPLRKSETRRNVNRKHVGTENKQTLMSSDNISLRGPKWKKTCNVNVNGDTKSDRMRVQQLRELMQTEIRNEHQYLPVGNINNAHIE